jgi:phytoene dehydrogenase-like protein
MSTRPVSVGVVGGGIAGLYCAWKLGSLGHSVSVFETLDRLGGRIETLDLDGFKAECGPMRFELATQPKLRKLGKKTLGITFTDFTPPTGEDPLFPRYDLEQKEKSQAQLRAEKRDGANQSQLTRSLDLLKYGVYRMVTEDRKRSLPEVVDPKETSVIARYALDLTEDDEREIRQSRRLYPGGPTLNSIGLWNALSLVLSPGAVAKVRDVGTFYHLMPDNPSASEWSIFWLRLFRPDAALSTIAGGVDLLVTRLKAKLAELPPEKVIVQTGATVTRVGYGQTQEKVCLSVEYRRNSNTHRSDLDFDHVILALPQWPLRRLAQQFPDEIVRDIDGVIGIPLLKAFLVTRKPWWTARTPAQRGAHLVPTRELHYWLSHDAPEAKGMVMLYTDRPATAYWQPYVAIPHDRAQVNTPDELKTELVRHLLHALKAYADESTAEGASATQTGNATNGHGEHPVTDPAATGNIQKRLLETLSRVGREMLKDPTLDVQWQKMVHVTAFAIRDWSKPPFGAAVHAWMPGTDVPAALDRLAAFGLLGREIVPNVHVCGEAYSDYQGFIEGSLRSADKVLAKI